MRAVKVDFVIDPTPKSKSHHRHHASLLHRLQQLMRSAHRPLRHVNMTRVKGVYEVRIFNEMRANDSEVARRVDSLQLYNKFSDLNRMLTRSLAHSGSQGVILDDVGYASRHMLHRRALHHGELADCVEEGLLQDARRSHQYVVLIAFVFLGLTTCVGSLVFTIKQPSTVPSRMNPLVRQGGEVG